MLLKYEDLSLIPGTNEKKPQHGDTQHVLGRQRQEDLWDWTPLSLAQSGSSKPMKDHELKNKVDNTRRTPPKVGL